MRRSHDLRIIKAPEAAWARCSRSMVVSISIMMHKRISNFKINLESQKLRGRSLNFQFSSFASMISMRLRRFLFNPSNLLFLLIVALSAFLRLWGIGNNPLWYPDEGANLNIAWNLINGRMQMFAVTYPFMPHPPLFYLISGLALKIFGYNLLVGRILTAIYGVITTVVLFYLGKALLNEKLGLIASFLFSIFPLAIMYNRWDFDYNLLQLLSIFTLFACIKYLKTKNGKWFYAGTIGVAAASVTGFSGLGLVFGLFFLFFVSRDIKLTLKAVLIAFGVFAIYLLSMFALQWNALVFDLEKILSSGGTGVSFFENFKALLLYSPWITVGLVGLLAYPLFFRRKKESVIMVGLFSCLLLFTLALFPIQGPQIRGIIQLFPFLALGIAIVIWGVLQTIMNPLQAKLHRTLKKPKALKLAVLSLWICGFLLLAIPFGRPFLDDFNSVFTGFHSELDIVCAQSPNDAYAVTNYVNSQTNSDDFVIASTQISWLLHCNHTDIEQAIAITHAPVPFYPTNMADSRFMFNCSYQNAKFLVADNLSKLWYIPTLNFIQANWTSVYSIGEYTVYLNPEHDS